MKKRKAVFLDRDGVINRCPGEHEYALRWEEMEILPGVKSALAEVKTKNYLVVVVTNQRGVARGKVRIEDVEMMHNKLNEELGGNIDGFYICPHMGDEPECDCRKPKPGMILRAARELNIDRGESWMVGDAESDVECGINAGVRTIKMETDGSLLEAVREILK